MLYRLFNLSKNINYYVFKHLNHEKNFYPFTMYD